ncbi:MAG: PDZ domain-containing protein [Arenimonas sp.]
MFFNKSSRLPVWAVLFALTFLFIGRIEASTLSDIYKPVVMKLGSPEVLYHADAAQIKKLFPLGTTKDKIHAKFGSPPQDYGSTAERDVYGYSMSYRVFNKDKSSFTLMRTSSAYVTYDAKGKINNTETSVFSSYVKSAKSVVLENRQPTEAEINQYLMPVNPALADAIILQGFSDSALSQPKTALTAKPWRLGIQIESKEAGQTWSGTRFETVIKAFAPDSIAQEGGMQIGDVVLEVNGIKIQNASQLSVNVGNADPTKPLTVKIKRGHDEQNFVFQPKN